MKYKNRRRCYELKYKDIYFKILIRRFRNQKTLRFK